MVTGNMYVGRYGCSGGQVGASGGRDFVLSELKDDVDSLLVNGTCLQTKEEWEWSKFEFPDVYDCPERYEPTPDDQANPDFVMPYDKKCNQMFVRGNAEVCAH